MGIMSEAAQDVQDIIEKEGEDCIFTVTDGLTVVTATCKALPTAYQALVGADFGEPVSMRTARLMVSELSLKELDYPTRNTNGKVWLKGHRITYTDVSEEQATYIITDQFPNSLTGLIYLQLSEFATPTPPGRVIIGWTYHPIDIEIVVTPNDGTQELPNGDTIPTQYALNEDGTLTIPYLEGLQVLTPFMLSEFPIQDMAYNQTTGTFDNSVNNGFVIGALARVNAVIPIFANS